MNKDIARLLLPIVNDPHVMGIISRYVETRIDHHHKQMENEADVKFSQGAIRELRRLDTLREEVLGELNANK